MQISLVQRRGKFVFSNCSLFMHVARTLISWTASNTLVVQSITMAGHVKKSYGGLARPGPAWPGPAWHGPAWHGPAWHSPAQPGPAWHCLARPCPAWLCPAWPCPACPCLACPCPACPCPACPSPAWPTVLWTHSARVSGVVSTCADGQRFTSSCHW